MPQSLKENNSDTQTPAPRWHPSVLQGPRRRLLVTWRMKGAMLREGRLQLPAVPSSAGRRWLALGGRQGGSGGQQLAPRGTAVHHRHEGTFTDGPAATDGLGCLWATLPQQSFDNDSYCSNDKLWFSYAANYPQFAFWYKALQTSPLPRDHLFQKILSDFNFILSLLTC